MQTAGTSLRSATTVNFEPLIEGILKCTQEFSVLPTLGTYWYDASRDALFTDQHNHWHDLGREGPPWAHVC